MLKDLIGVSISIEQRLLAGFLISLAGTLIAAPMVLRKLRGAGILGRDMNKPGHPRVPEMGGIVVFLGTNAGVFLILALDGMAAQTTTLILAATVTCAGAAMTGVIDDLVILRQRFKAFIPIVFAAPLALFLTDFTVQFPVLGTTDFGYVYPFLLVPLGIACASNGMNMLEGFNGLGAGLAIVMTTTLIIAAFVSGRTDGLVLLLPLLGALFAFLAFNVYPARVFPGDTFTLFVGCVIAAGAILSKLEFLGAVLFLPHVIEFFLKLKGHFKAESFATHVSPNPGKLAYTGPTQSLSHIVMKNAALREWELVALFWMAELGLAFVALAAFLVWGH